MESDLSSIPLKGTFLGGNWDDISSPPVPLNDEVISVSRIEGPNMWTNTEIVLVAIAVYAMALLSILFWVVIWTAKARAPARQISAPTKPCHICAKDQSGAPFVVNIEPDCNYETLTRPEHTFDL